MKGAFTVSSPVEKVKKTVYKYDMLNSGDRVVTGISGGPDSLAMLYILRDLSVLFDLSIHVAHLDHQLRGEESDADASFVKRTAEKLNLSFTICKKDVESYSKEHGLSIEEAARKVRYDFFIDLAKNINADKISVGHNADDQAETFFMRIVRGAGLEGLCGIPPVRDVEEGIILIRPLISLSRKEIESYCSKMNLKPRIDSTNKELTYKRNRIRLELIPIIEKEYNNNIKEIINNTVHLLRDDADYLNRVTESVYNKIRVEKSGFEVSLNKDFFQRTHSALKRRLLRRALYEVRGDLKDLYSANIEEILNALEDNKIGKWIDLPGKVFFYIDYEFLHFTARKFEKFKRKSVYRLAAPGRNIIPGWNYELKIKIIDTERVEKIQFERIPDNKAFLDWNKVQIEGLPLLLRNRRKGDWFKPLGIDGKKKLKDFFIDQKVPKYRRDEVPVITAFNGRIIWVAGYRIDDSFKLTDSTKQIISIKGDYHRERGH